MIKKSSLIPRYENIDKLTVLEIYFIIQDRFRYL